MPVEIRRSMPCGRVSTRQMSSVVVMLLYSGIAQVTGVRRTSVKWVRRHGVAFEATFCTCWHCYYDENKINQ